jgi:hypothetical protein
VLVRRPERRIREPFNERAAAKSGPRAARRRDGRTIVEPPAAGGETACVGDAEGPASRRRRDARARSAAGSRCSAARARVQSSAVAGSGVRPSAPASSSSRARRRYDPVARAPALASRDDRGPRSSSSGRPGRGARRDPRRAQATRRPGERRPRQFADDHPRDRASVRLARRGSAAATRCTVVRCARVGSGHRGVCPSAPGIEARRRDRPSRPGVASDQTAVSWKRVTPSPLGAASTNPRNANPRANTKRRPRGFEVLSAPQRIRTSDLRLRRPSLSARFGREKTGVRGLRVPFVSRWVGLGAPLETLPAGIVGD